MFVGDHVALPDMTVRYRTVTSHMTVRYLTVMSHMTVRYLTVMSGMSVSGPVAHPDMTWR